MWLKQIADVTERAPERVERSGLGLAQVGFDLGEGLFNWIKIRRISRPKQEPGSLLAQAWAAFSLLWTARLSRITTSPFDKVGASCVSM